MRKNILYLVVPCYNEEEVLEETTRQLHQKMEYLIDKKLIDRKSKVLYVNDGSKDQTWNLIKQISEKDTFFTGISLSHNRGHQNALTAGLLTAKEYADVVISMDADLQDDIHAIDAMMEEYHKGCDIVYGVRASRQKDTWFKRTTAQGFYKVMKWLGVDIVYNHADYRLTSKRVLEAFSSYEEVNLFLRAMFPLIGYQTGSVYYERKERFAGTSKYPLKKMLQFAWEGITSFSIKPIRFVLTMGIVVFLISLIMIVYTLFQKILGHTVAGWAFTMISIWFVAGIQMLSLGLIGEYIGKIYQEVKHRPRFLIGESLLETASSKREK